MSKVNIINGKEYTNEEAHRLLWNWLADNPEKSKIDFFCEHDCNRDPRNDCYACETADWYVDEEEEGYCGNCPINWGKLKPFACEHCKTDEDFEESDIVALYEQWKIESQLEDGDLEKLSNLARQIAQMEWYAHEK